MRSVLRAGNRRRRSSTGQGITEYAAIMAFVAGLITIVFALPASPLYNSVQNAFQSIINQMSNLVAGVPSQ